MPKSIRLICITNFLNGMGIFSYTLFFTDFVGECVFGGNPQAPKGSKSYELYKEGVRFGCWGFAFASLCCAFASTVLEDLAEKFGKLMMVMQISNVLLSWYTRISRFSRFITKVLLHCLRSSLLLHSHYLLQHSY